MARAATRAIVHEERNLFGLAFLLLSLVGAGYTLHAAIAVERFRRRAPPPPVAAEPVSLLKPLHGDEPRLRENLASFLDQDWDAPIELVAGVQRGDDPAADVVETLLPSRAREGPGVGTCDLSEGGTHRGGSHPNPSPEGEGRIAVKLIRDPSPHGANAKIANLSNMLPHAMHDLIVLSDSDMAAPRDYLAQLAAALGQPGVGVVSCLYHGRADAGPWSVLAAGAISYQFMPSILVAIAFGHAIPCMGSTIALRRGTLARIGGFARFADVLADDNAIGAAVAEIGLKTALPPMVLAHGCTETSLGALWRHELRWSATIRSVSRISHFGLVATFPVAFALLTLPFEGRLGAAALALALAARLALIGRVDRLIGRSSAPLWMLVPRDCLSFGVWVAALVARSVEWRGLRLTMRGEGRIAAGAGR